MLDLGSCREEECSDDYHVRTVEFHAPEIRELKERRDATDSIETAANYWSAADVWPAALCLAEFTYPEQRLTMFWSREESEDSGKGVIDDVLRSLIEDLRY